MARNENARTGEKSERAGLPSSLLTSKLQALREAIQELDLEIRKREALSQRFLEAIGKECERIQDLLSRLGEPWSKGYLPEFEGLRTKLVQELFNLTNRERSERLRMWEDIASLKKQRRTLLMEYQALKETAGLLGGAGEGEGA